MKFCEEDNAHEDIPECGAIFMASIFTKKECLERRLLALPSAKAHFVKHIKAGMLLFLFEYGKKQLYGVFQATTDGTMDIVPDAFQGRFPAQVRFKPVWNCHPLNENEFRDSIEENYFARFKFKFGLTEDQVLKLLSLFSSRKIMKLSPCVPKKVRDKVFASDNSEFGQNSYKEDNDRNPSSLSECLVASPIRPNEDERNAYDVVNGVGKAYRTDQNFLINCRDDLLSERRRLDRDDVLIKNDKAECEKDNDHGIWRSRHTDSSVDPLEVRRPVGTKQSFISGKVHDENQMDYMSNHAIDKYPIDPREARVSQCMQGDKLLDGSNPDYGLDLGKNRHVIDDNTFMSDYPLHGEFNDSVRPMVPSDHSSKIVPQAMSRSGNYQFFMNGIMKDKFEGVPVSSSEPLSNQLHGSRTTAGGMLLNTDRMDDPYNFVASVIGSSSKNILPQLDREKTLYDRKLSFAEPRVTDNTLDSILCATTSNDDAVYISSTGRRFDRYGSFKNSDRVEDVEVNHGFVGPAMSKYSLSSNPKQFLSSSSDNPVPETWSSSLPADEKYDPSHPGYDDSSISRDAPCVPELPYASHGCSAFAHVDNKSSAEKRTHLHNGTLPKSYSLSFGSSLPLSFSQKTNRFIDVELAFGNNSSPTKLSTLQSSLPCRTTHYFHNSNLPMLVAPNISTAEFDNSVLSRLHSHPQPHTGHENIDGGKMLHDYPSKSTENPFSSSGRLQMASHYVSEHVSCNQDNNDFARGSPQPARDLSSFGNENVRTSGDDNINEHHRILEAPQSGPNTIRRSVFTRLTPGQDVQVSEHGNDAQFDSDDQYMDTSADEIMEMLHQRNILSLRKLKDPTSTVQPKHFISESNKNKILSHTDLIHSTFKKKKLEDSYLEIAEPESTGDVLEETRIVDFRRRSVKNKSSVGTKNDPVKDTDITFPADKVERPPEKTLKRKKLIRPVLEKTEPAIEVTSSNCASELSEPTQVSDVEKSICICKDEAKYDNALSSKLALHKQENDDCRRVETAETRKACQVKNHDRDKENWRNKLMDH